MISILHTVVPLEQVFPGEMAQTELLSHGGALVEGVRQKQGFQITRVISTDPAMYLNKKYSVGAYLK